MPLVGHSPRWTLDSPQQLRFIIQKEKRATSSIVVHEQPHQLRPALEIADRTTVGEEQRNERPKSPLTTTAAPLSLDRRDNSNQRIYMSLNRVNQVEIHHYRNRTLLPLHLNMLKSKRGEPWNKGSKLNLAIDQRGKEHHRQALSISGWEINWAFPICFSGPDSRLSSLSDFSLCLVLCCVSSFPSLSLSLSLSIYCFLFLTVKVFLSGGVSISSFRGMATTESDLDEFLNLDYELRYQNLPDTDAFVSGVCSAAFQNHLRPDVVASFSTCDALTDTLCSQNPTPTITATIDSQSSIYGTVGSPVSANKPNSRENHTKGTSSGSSDPSDEDDEAGACEQSTNPVDVKRLRRKESNRDSARRSRRRKQAQLTELETQVEKLKLDNATLYQHYTEASQQFREADTNNRVLKSDVEALRAKVKLAEDMVTRSSFTTLNNQLLQTPCQLSTPPQLNTTSLRRMAHVSPTITVHGNDAPYSGVSTVVEQNLNLGFGNLDMTYNNVNNNGVISNAMSCVTIWP